MLNSQSIGTKIQTLLVFTCLLACVFNINETQAGKLYRFEDSHGNGFLTNEIDSQKHPLNDRSRQYTKLVKVTWYPDTNVHRYSNWGSSEAAIKPSASRNRNTYDSFIRAASDRYRVDFGLLKAVIHTESGFDPNARSAPGAQGLMQLMPATARRYKVSNVWDPQENINAGSRHLRYLLTRYQSVPLALAAYNAGEGNINKYNGIPPFYETQDYIKRVTGRFNDLYGGTVTMVGEQ